MQQFAEFIRNRPVVPFIRECDFAVRRPWEMKERRLLDYLLIYVQDGRCRFTVDGVRHEFGKGDLCLIQPGSVNILEGLTNTVTPFAHFDVFYNPYREQSFPTRAGQLHLDAYAHLMQPKLNEAAQVHIPVRLAVRNPVKFRDTFLRVVEYWQYEDPVMQLKAQTGMAELVTALIEDYAPQKHTLPASRQTLNWITSYFSLHLNEPIAVADMAKRANLSVSRFNELFRKQYGMTPHQYLLDMRISHACELLRTTELTQERIAGYCGFSDIHHFSKAFKGRTGVSPGDYRKGEA